MISINEIIKRQKVLNLLSPDDIDDIPGRGNGGGGSTGGDVGTPQGGNGGGPSGTNSGIIVPGLTLNPSTTQSVAIGTTICYNASGSISIPQESQRFAMMDIGCAKSLGTGTWIKTCGTNNAPDAETLSSTIIYRKQPFHIVGTNGAFSTPGGSINNSECILGIKTTNGYYFFWSVFKYCNATPGSCASNWLGSVRVVNPDGTGVTLGTGLVEFNQQFRVKSDGTRIIWEYTTHNNWVYNYTSINIPSDAGDFQFFVNALYLNNTWTNLNTYKGSYQGSIPSNEFIWSSNCPDNIEINGSSACLTPTLPGSCTVCVSTLTNNPICSSIVATPLYLKPIDYECDSCGITTNCNSIPDPTTPIIDYEVLETDRVKISWDDSLSFTNGLHYEFNLNTVSEDILDSTLVLSDLPNGTYLIKVKAIDDCGESVWSNQISLTVPLTLIVSPSPTTFILSRVSDNLIATWSPVVGAVSYEIWAGDPQTVFIVSTNSTTINLGNLRTGIQLSFRVKFTAGTYSSFSNVEIS